MIHASVEFVKAMGGDPPGCSADGFDWSAQESACGARATAEDMVAWACVGFASARTATEETLPVDCPACLALFPPRARVVTDAIEEGRDLKTLKETF